jgi:endo-1,4-beta-xylanase
MRGRLAVALVALVSPFLLVAPARTAPAPLARCERSKLAVAGRTAMGMLRCHANAAGSGVTVDAACLRRIRDSLAARFAAGEARSPCPFEGEATAVTAALDAVTGVVAGALAPPAGSSACAKQKLLAAGKRQRRTLAAQGKHAGRPERERLGVLLDKANARYSADWTRAEALGDCVAVGDAAAVAIELDAGSADVVDEIRGTLKALAGGRLMGSAVRFDALPESSYRETAARHFNHVSTWGETVWVNVEPTQGVFDLGPLDQVVDFAEQHAMPVKGITLVWHELLPAWMPALTDPVDFRSAMEAHVSTLVGGYAGRIAIWDVVNEAIQSGDYRDSVFLQRLGPDYIADAFDMAHQADPSALLFYNDYGIETFNPSSDFLYAMVVDLLAQGVPIHGIGFQMHMGVTSYWNPAAAAQVQQNLQRFADLGLLIQLAEAEASLGFAVGHRPTELLQQRDTYNGMVTVCLAVPGCHMNFFGFTDRHYWPIVFNRDPLMFDVNYLPKPAFFGVRDALLGY